MEQKTKMLFVIPVLLAIVVGTVGLSNAYAESKLVTPTPFAPTLDFDLKTSGWAVSNGEAYPGEIVLSGETKQQNEILWGLVADGTVHYGTGKADISMKGTSNTENGKIKLTGKGLTDSGVEFILVLRGNFAPIHEMEGQYALNWSTAKIYVPDTGIKIPLLQQGIIEVMP